jgi:hypothetical protein
VSRPRAEVGSYTVGDTAHVTRLTELVDQRNVTIAALKPRPRNRYASLGAPAPGQEMSASAYSDMDRGCGHNGGSGVASRIRSGSGVSPRCDRRSWAAAVDRAAPSS